MQYVKPIEWEISKPRTNYYIKLWANYYINIPEANKTITFFLTHSFYLSQKFTRTCSGPLSRYLSISSSFTLVLDFIFVLFLAQSDGWFLFLAIFVRVFSFFLFLFLSCFLSLFLSLYVIRPFLSLFLKHTRTLSFYKLNTFNFLDCSLSLLSVLPLCLFPSFSLSLTSKFSVTFTCLILLFVKSCSLMHTRSQTNIQTNALKHALCMWFFISVSTFRNRPFALIFSPSLSLSLSHLNPLNDPVVFSVWLAACLSLSLSRFYLCFLFCSGCLPPSYTMFLDRVFPAFSSLTHSQSQMHPASFSLSLSSSLTLSFCHGLLHSFKALSLPPSLSVSFRASYSSCHSLFQLRRFLDEAVTLPFSLNHFLWHDRSFFLSLCFLFPFLSLWFFLTPWHSFSLSL